MTIPARPVIVSVAFLVILQSAAAFGQEPAKELRPLISPRSPLAGWRCLFARAPRAPGPLCGTQREQNPGSGPYTDPESAVAIVSAITGTASVAVPSALRTATLRLFEWVPAGSIIEVARGATVTLVFASGARYELGDNAKVTVGATSLASTAGVVRPLAAVPPLPRIAPITERARPGARAAVIRIRAGTIAGLYPDGVATLAESTVLRFRPVQGASRYSVEVETESGTTVFQVETQSATVSISPDILEEGARYYWQVRTLDKIGEVARGVAEFVTLEEEPARAHATLKASLDAAGDAPSLALLAEIDRGLGLLAEARDGFRAALARAPGDSGIREALEALERQLASEGEKSAR